MTTNRKTKPVGMIAMIWLAFGCVIGLAFGFFSYLRQTPAFESSAQIQIRYANQNASATEAMFDESLVIVGRPNVASAVQSNRLAQLSELHDGLEEPNEDRAIKSLLSEGRLAANRIAVSPQGGIYEIRFRGATPGSSRQVVDAIVDAYANSMPVVGDRAAWDESIRLLSESRDAVSKRLEELHRQLHEVELPMDAVLREGELVSEASTRWQMLQSDIDAQHEALAGLRKRIDSIETLVDDGATPETILKQLEQPLSRRTLPTTIPITTNGTPESSADSQQRRQEIEAMKRRVDQELAPLEEELARLLERYGSSHPTVVGVKRKIDSVKSKLGVVDEKIAPVAVESKKALRSGTEEEKLAAVDTLIKTLKSEQQKREAEIEALMTQLDETAVRMAQQDRSLRRQQSLRSQIARQEELESKIVSRVEQLSGASPFASKSLEVLVPAEPGDQVAPSLMPNLVIGGTLGAFVGFAIGLLMMLAAALGNHQSVADEQGSEFVAPQGAAMT